MNQLIKELVALRDGLSNIITIILKILVSILTALNLSKFPIVDKFIKFANKTLGVLDKYTPKVDEKIEALRKKNGVKRNIRAGFAVLFLFTSIMAGFSALLFPSHDNIFFRLLDDNILYVLGFAVICFLISVHLLSKRYYCPVCYFEEAKILDKAHLGSKSHYETWSRHLGNGWIDEQTYKTGTTNHYEYLVKCNCCGHVSVYRQKEFSKR